MPNVHRVHCVRVASLLLLAASLPATAAEVDQPTEATPVEQQPAPPQVPAAAAPVIAPQPTSASVVQKVTPAEAPAPPYAGSKLIYSHGATAISVDKGAEPMWNPYYVHSISIRPNWSFNEQLSVSGRLDIEQELTLADDTTRSHQIMPSDLSLDVIAAGVTDPWLGLKLGGSVRVIAPTSKASSAQTLLFGVGPGLSLSRMFEVGAGLKVTYGARYTQNFNRYTTVQNNATTIAACSDFTDARCNSLISTGQRNTRGYLRHGPMVTFDPIASVHLLAWYVGTYSWLYPLAADTKFQSATRDPGARETTRFILSAEYDVTREFTVGIGSDTLTVQPGVGGVRLNPFFNRYTTIGLDLTLNVEGLLSRI